MSDRIPCINPRCRRAAPANKYEPGVEIVCRGCWRLLPRHLTDPYKRLAKLRRKMVRLARKPDRAAQAEGLLLTIERAQDRNWQAIRGSLLGPAEPAGLGRFLEEMGFA